MKLTHFTKVTELISGVRADSCEPGEEFKPVLLVCYFEDTGHPEVLVLDEGNHEVMTAAQQRLNGIMNEGGRALGFIGSGGESKLCLIYREYGICDETWDQAVNYLDQFSTAFCAGPKEEVNAEKAVA
jgi:hypothetical protein